MSGDVSTPVSADLVLALRDELRRIAKCEDDLAADESAQVPYWLPCPDSVNAHRIAAAALRRHAVSVTIARGATD
jgi:hypothetical protein